MSEGDHKRLVSLLQAYFQADQHLNVARFRECISKFSEDEIFVKITSIEGQLGINSFNIAATRNHTNVLKAMLDLFKPRLQKELIFFRDFQRSFTVLHWAALKGFRETFEVLLSVLTPEQQCAVMKLQDNSGKTALYILADEGHIETFKFIRELFTLEDFCNLLKIPNEEHVSLLCQAVMKDNKAIVRTIINSLDQADLDHLLLLPDQSGNTAMHFAAMNGFSEIAGIILDSTTPETRAKLLEMQNKGIGESPVHIAVSKGHVDTFRLLLQYSHDMFSAIALTTIESGHTALHLAAKSESVEMMKEVLGNMVDRRLVLLELTDNIDATALHWATQTGKEEMVRLLLYQLDEKDLLELLQKQDNVGNTALHWAVLHESLDVVKYILNKLPPNKRREVLEFLNNHGNSVMEVAKGRIADFLAQFMSSNLDVQGAQGGNPPADQKPIPARRFPSMATPATEEVSLEVHEEDNLPTEALNSLSELPTRVVGSIDDYVHQGAAAAAQPVNVFTEGADEVEMLRTRIRDLEQVLVAKNQKISDQDFIISDLKKQVKNFKDKSSRNERVKKKLAEYLDKLHP